MAGHTGSTRVYAMEHEGQSSADVADAEMPTDEYLDELKRFAAVVNGMPVSAPDGAPAPPKPTGDVLSVKPGVARPERSRVEPSFPSLEGVPVDDGEYAWWRALDARLANAPHRPRFVARRAAPRIPVVTHTAPPTKAPTPPPQLRREIDAAPGPDLEAGAVRRTGWDRIDTYLSAAGLTVVLLGSIVASAPTETLPTPPAATIDLPVPSVNISEGAGPPSPNGRIGPGRLLPPAPPPFPVTVALVTERSGTFLSSIGDRAFGPIALASDEVLPRVPTPSVQAPAVQTSGQIRGVQAPTVQTLSQTEDVQAPPLQITPDEARAGGLVDTVKAEGVTEPIPPRAATSEEKIGNEILLAATEISLPLIREPIPEVPPDTADLAKIAAATADSVGAVPPAGGTAVRAGTWNVHLASVRDERFAADTWRQLQEQHAALDAMGLVVKRVDLGEKGIWFRILTGPFANLGEASSVCGTLADQYCQPMRDERG